MLCSKILLGIVCPIPFLLAISLALPFDMLKLLRGATTITYELAQLVQESCTIIVLVWTFSGLFLLALLLLVLWRGFSFASPPASPKDKKCVAVASAAILLPLILVLIVEIHCPNIAYQADLSEESITEEFLFMLQNYREDSAGKDSDFVSDFFRNEACCGGNSYTDFSKGLVSNFTWTQPYWFPRRIPVGCCLSDSGFLSVSDGFSYGFYADCLTHHDDSSKAFVRGCGPVVVEKLLAIRNLFWAFCSLLFLSSIVLTMVQLLKNSFLQCCSRRREPKAVEVGLMPSDSV